MSIKSILRVNEHLDENQRLTSPNGKYWVVLQGDHNFCEYDSSGKRVWAVMYEPGNYATFVMVRDSGELATCWPGPGNYSIWNSGSGGKGDGSTVLLIANDGNMALYTTYQSEAGDVYVDDKGVIQLRSIPKKIWDNGYHGSTS